MKSLRRSRSVSADWWYRSGMASPVDVFETENELVVSAQLPGIKKEDLQIQLENNLLTIKGVRQPDHDTTGTVLRVERSYGPLIGASSSHPMSIKTVSSRISARVF